MSTRLYAVMRLSRWDDILFESPHPLVQRAVRMPQTDPLQPCAFIPCFATREAALEWANGDASLISIVQERTP